MHVYLYLYLTFCGRMDGTMSATESTFSLSQAARKQSMFHYLHDSVISIIYCTQALVWKPLPSLVFGVLSTISGLLYVFLPETLGQVLPDTIEQAERLECRSKTDKR